MTCWVVLPVKAPAECKTRLTGAMPDGDRRELVAAMLAHAAREAVTTPGVDRVALLGPERHGLPEAMPLIAEDGAGLDAAAAQAVRAAGAGVDRLILLSPDLPRVTADEIAMLADLPAHVVGIASDRAGQGTNALSLPLPAARDFRFGYGPASFGRHATEAGRLGLEPQSVDAPGLAFDIDTPEDLAALR